MNKINYVNLALIISTYLIKKYQILAIMIIAKNVKIKIFIVMVDLIWLQNMDILELTNILHNSFNAPESRHA